MELILSTFRNARITNPVEIARDGQEALDYIFCRGAHAGREAISPRLILLDLKLPKIDGIEVLRAIKADPHTKAVPVVILTASHEERDRIDGYELGVSGYIEKPVDFAQFRKTIREMAHYWLVLNQSTADPRKSLGGASETQSLLQATVAYPVISASHQILATALFGDSEGSQRPVSGEVAARQTALALAETSS